MTLFLIVGDLHGQIPRFKRTDFDAIIAPGDFCSDGSKYYQYKALAQRMNGKDVTWMDLAGKSRARQMIRKSHRDGRAILKRLNSYGVPVYVVPGNWDPADKWLQLKKGLKHIHDAHQHRIDVADITIIGHGFSQGPEFPPTAKDEKRYDKKLLNELRKDFNYQMREYSRLIRSTKNPVLLLSHNVPYNTPIDMIVNKASPRNGEHFGSLIARKLILQHKPLLCIGGHMHEHFTSCKLGRTVCVNTGFGREVHTMLDIQNGKIKSLEFFENGKKKKITQSSQP